MTFTLRPTTPADIPTLHRLMRDFATYEKLEHRFKITEADLHDALFGPKPMLDSIARRGRRQHRRLRPVVSSPSAPSPAATACSSRTSSSNRRTAAAASAWRCSATWRASRVERDCIDMEWNVLDWNTPAIEFYRRIGASRCDGWIPQQLSGDALTALADGARQWLTRPSTSSSSAAAPAATSPRSAPRNSA